MPLPDEIKVSGYLGHGGNAVVLRVEYESQQFAMKIGYKLRGLEWIAKQGLAQEFRVLNDLKGIPGIPRPRLLLENVEGTYAELGLSRSGKVLEEMTHHESCREPYFAGILLMELLRLQKLSNDNKQSATFFDELDSIVEKVYRAGYLLPFDISIQSAGGHPFLIDWTLAARVNESSDDKCEKIKKENRAMIDNLRRSFQAIA